MTGEKLREARVRQGLTIEAASDRVKIPTRFLAALEEGRIGVLGGLLYARRYVKDYAQFLGIYSGEFMENCMREWDISALRKKRGEAKPFYRKIMPVVGPKHALLALGAFLTIAVLGYFVYQLSLLISAPVILITSPASNLVATQDSVFDIAGSIHREARVSVNRRPVEVASDGEFRERLYLTKGLNRIDVEATNISGKTESITRYVMVY